MNEFSAWMQSNWYALGNLFIEGAFLAAGVWFARKFLRTIRASQEQVGALLKLSLTGAISERHSTSGAAERSFASASPYWLTPAEIPPAPAQELHESGPSRLAGARQRRFILPRKPTRGGEGAPGRRGSKVTPATARRLPGCTGQGPIRPTLT